MVGRGKCSGDRRFEVEPTPYKGNAVMLVRLRSVLGCLLLAGLGLPADSATADWNQWRGPKRTGAVEAPPLLETLPERGLQPLWRFDSLQGGSSGGWGSPVIADGRVYVFAHQKTRREGVPLDPPQYPALPPEQRVGMSDQEYREYEDRRREESERRATQGFRFDERLLCLDLTTGNVVWDRQQPSVYTRFTQSGTPAISDGRVFILAPGRLARCYDASSGELVWETRLPGDFRDEFYCSSFAVDGGTAVVACGPLFALDAADGNVRWQGTAPIDYASHSSPVIWTAGDRSLAIANINGGRTVGYDLRSGEAMWELQTGTGQSSPIVVGNQLIVYGGSRKSGLQSYTLDAADAAGQPPLQWRFQRVADQGSTPAIADQAVFVQGERRVAKVRLSDGDTLWQTNLKVSNPRYTSPIVVGDQLLYAWEGVIAMDAAGDRAETLYHARIDSDGQLIGTEQLRQRLELDQLERTQDGLAEAERLWQREAIRSGPLACATPAFADGLLVVRLRNGLVCYDLRKP